MFEALCDAGYSQTALTVRSVPSALIRKNLSSPEIPVCLVQCLTASTHRQLVLHLLCPQTVHVCILPFGEHDIRLPIPLRRKVSAGASFTIHIPKP